LTAWLRCFVTSLLQGDMGEAGVALGGGYSSDEDCLGDSANGHRGRQHTHRQHQHQSDGGSSSDAEDAGPAEVDAAYLGMARKQQQQQQQLLPQQQEGTLSVAEQEAMALQLLAAQPW
jgi:hypothetical protein